MAQIRYEAQGCRFRMLKKLAFTTILYDTLENYMMQYRPLEQVIIEFELDVFVPTDNPFAFGLKI